MEQKAELTQKLTVTQPQNIARIIKWPCKGESACNLCQMIVSVK